LLAYSSTYRPINETLFIRGISITSRRSKYLVLLQNYYQRHEYSRVPCETCSI